MLDQSYFDAIKRIDQTAPITHIVSVGGGLSSTIELPDEVIRKYGKENVVLAIAALDGESDDLWRTVDECEKRTGLRVQRISYDRDVPQKYRVNADPKLWWNIWDVFESVGMMVSSLRDPCSRLLKRETMRRWITNNYHPEFAVLHVGITFDEWEREVAIKKHWQSHGYKVESDLIKHRTDKTKAEKSQCLIGWIPLAYRLGFPHNNCNKFCGKAGHKEMARLLWYDPHTFFYHAEREAMFCDKFGTTATIMRDRKTVYKETTIKIASNQMAGSLPGFAAVPEITEMKKMISTIESTSLTMYEFALRMWKRWATLLPGETPFYDDLDDTPGCKFCDSMA